MTRFDKEQSALVATVEKKTDGPTLKGKSLAWNKYNGDIACRTVIAFLRSHFGDRVKGPNAYISGYPTEFDAIITKRGVIDDPCRYAFEPKDIRCVIEVKGWGLIGEGSTRRLVNEIADIKKCFSGINFGYVGVFDRPGNRSVIRKRLGRTPCFFMANQFTLDIYSGELKKLVEFVRKA